MLDLRSALEDRMFAFRPECMIFMSFVFQVDDLLLIEEKIDLEVRSLETCMYEHKTFTEILNRVQKAVDDLNLHSYSNLPIWVNKLDIEVCAKPLQHSPKSL